MGVQDVAKRISYYAQSRDMPSMKRRLRWGVILLAAGCLLAVGAHRYGARSEPYRFSEQWVRQSAEVREKIGEVKRTHLSISGVSATSSKEM